MEYEHVPMAERFLEMETIISEHKTDKYFKRKYDLTRNEYIAKYENEKQIFDSITEYDLQLLFHIKKSNHNVHLKFRTAAKQYYESNQACLKIIKDFSNDIALMAKQHNQTQA